MMLSNPDELAIPAIDTGLDGTVEVPPSKSLTHRALGLAVLAEGDSTLENVLVADDTVWMARALRELGGRIEPIGPDSERLAATLESAPSGGPGPFPEPLGPPPAGSVRVRGGAGSLRAPRTPLYVGGAGTAMRLLTAMASLVPGEVVLDGDERMRQRPLGPLLAALEALGVGAVSVRGDGCPPVRLRGGGLVGGSVRLRGDISSQFVSALLMVAPLARGRVIVEIQPPFVSWPYVRLSIALMSAFGIELTQALGAAGSSPPAAGDGPSSNETAECGERSARGPSAAPPPAAGARGKEEAAQIRRFVHAGGATYRPASLRIPADASSAAYFFAAAGACGGSIRVPGLGADDPQADAAILEHLRQMGCEVVHEAGATVIKGPGERRLRSFDLDLSQTPDLVPTLAVLALFAGGRSRIRNVASLRLKESDRLAATAEGLTRLGAAVIEQPDGLEIAPRRLRGARIATYNDHRIAMAFAVAGLRIPGTTISNPGCVSKSFPGFWSALGRLAGSPGLGRGEGL